MDLTNHPNDSDNVIPLFSPSRCKHAWQPLDGWRARYRCRLCGCIGRNLRAVTLLESGGPIGQPGVTAYRCRHKAHGERCAHSAVGRVDGTVLCAQHGGSAHTRSAREALRSR
jgi:hypothetical protein